MPPRSSRLRQFLGQVVGRSGTPKYLVCDRGTLFDNEGFRDWCRRHGIRQRLGAVGKRGSIAVVERFIGTLKRECTRAVPVVPLLRRAFRRELELFLGWYNADRPHMTLEGATPDEIYFGRCPASRKPRFEPRAAWPRASPCAKPRVLVKGQPGLKLELVLEFASGRRHLPRVALRRVA